MGRIQLDVAASSQLGKFAAADTLRSLMSQLGIFTVNPLTQRERDVLQWVAVGATNDQVAKTLGLTTATIKTYLERIQSKLNSRDRASAVAIALRRSWI